MPALRRHAAPEKTQGPFCNVLYREYCSTVFSCLSSQAFGRVEAVSILEKAPTFE